MSPVLHSKSCRWFKEIMPSDPSTSFTTSARPSPSYKDDSKRCSLLTFRRSSQPQAKPPKFATEVLPAELWHKILRYTLRLTGAQAVDLKDPFESDYLQEDYPHIHPGYFEDRRSCRRVCHIFNTLVTEIMMEYIVIFTQAELEWTVKTLEGDVLTAQHKRLGDWTTRIDFCISGYYDPEWMLRLLTLTPNLLVYTTNTGRDDHPEHSMNAIILRALVDFHSKNLKRLDWAGHNDAPTYGDLHIIAKNIRSLTTLHLRHLYGLPPLTTSQPMLVFPSLRSLSLGLISLKKPPGLTDEDFPICWDFFLSYLVAHPFQLSKLERFDIDICPTPDFFAVYGDKIRTFRTCSWSAQPCLDAAFELLPNLQTFHYISHADTQCHIPVSQPTLQRIAIIPRIDNYVEVPSLDFQCCVIKPLDALLANIEDMEAKKLTHVRICDRGAFTGIFESDDCLFWHWRQRLRDLKNVQLQNKHGDLNTRYAKYGNNPPSGQWSGYRLVQQPHCALNQEPTEPPAQPDGTQTEPQSGLQSQPQSR